MFHKIIIAAAASIVWTAATLASSGADEQQIEMHRISERVHVLYGHGDLGSNVGAIRTDEGLMLVDTMWARSGEKLAAALATITTDQVSHVFNTHRHDDHTSGNAALLEQGAILVRQSGTPDEEGENQILFGESLTLNVGGVRIEAFGIAAHTPHDALVYLPDENVMFLGDAFTTNWHPTFYGGGEDGQLALINKALSLADQHTVFVPGHGKAVRREGLLLYKTVFMAWMHQMRTKMRDGQSVAAMKEDAGLQEIAGKFLQDGSVAKLPERAFHRFVERTISTELMPLDKAVIARLPDYAGSYMYDDGVSLEIRHTGDSLQLIENGMAAGHIVPLSSTRFHYPGRLEGEGHMVFELNEAGAVVGAAYVESERRFSAKRIGN